MDFFGIVPLELSPFSGNEPEFDHIHRSGSEYPCRSRSTCKSFLESFWGTTSTDDGFAFIDVIRDADWDCDGTRDKDRGIFPSNDDPNREQNLVTEGVKGPKNPFYTYVISKCQSSVSMKLMGNLRIRIFPSVNGHGLNDHGYHTSFSSLSQKSRIDQLHPLLFS